MWKALNYETNEKTQNYMSTDSNILYIKKYSVCVY